MINNKNIIINQINEQKDSFYIKETIPFFKDSLPEYTLSFDASLNLYWSKFIQPLEIKSGSNNIIITKKGNSLVIDTSLSTIDVSLYIDYPIIVDNKFKDTEIYYKDGKIGLGILPRYTYLFDIPIPKNTTSTAFHIGDGSYGFSIGNGAAQGFIPQILGLGSDENDAGLYFLGKSGNNETSNIPLIIMDGRNNYNSALENRPIFGITSGDYLNYKFIIDQYGRIGIGKFPKTFKMEVNGTIKANNIVIDDDNIKDLITIVKHQGEQIKTLIEIIKKL